MGSFYLCCSFHDYSRLCSTCATNFRMLYCRTCILYVRIIRTMYIVLLYMNWLCTFVLFLRSYYSYVRTMYFRTTKCRTCIMHSSNFQNWRFMNINNRGLLFGLGLFGLVRVNCICEPIDCQSGFGKITDCWSAAKLITGWKINWCETHNGNPFGIYR